MQACVNSDIKLVCDIKDNILVGGKQLRAAIVVLSCRLYAIDPALTHQIASAIEYIHVASLLHDDVVDKADFRRNRIASNRKYGNAAAVLVGDYFYSRATQMLMAAQSLTLLDQVANSTNALTEGEILQLINAQSPSVNQDAYFQIIEKKTANLFQLAASIGPIIAEDATNREVLAKYGHHFGIAFQIIDDCFDYDVQKNDTGKDMGQDYREGKITLPLILALRELSSDEQRYFLTALLNRDESKFSETLRLIEQSHALRQCYQYAQDHIGTALASLDTLTINAPEQNNVDLFRRLAEFCINRIR